MRILETFTADRTTQTAAEIGRRAGLPSASAHRIVGDLVAAGILSRDDERHIRVGLRLWELATRPSQALRLRQAALPYMELVQAQVREHTQLAIREQDEALFVEQLSDPRSGFNQTGIARRLPLHASSSGLVLLAFGDPELQDRVLASRLHPVTAATLVDPIELRRKLAEVRALSHAVAPGYIDDDSTGVAVPVRDGATRVVAALSVVLPRGAAVNPALLALHSAATGVSRALGTGT